MVFIFIFAAIILYHIARFVKLLVKMKQNILFPSTIDELEAIRKEPQRKMKEPTYSGQKGGIIFYISFLLFIITTFILALVFRQDAIFPSMIPLLYPLFMMSTLLNQFAFTKDGILSGARFTSWKRIQSYEFRRIDVNHRYYGHTKEVNDQLELRVQTKFWTYKCILMNEEVKMKVMTLFEEHGIEQNIKEEIVSES